MNPSFADLETLLAVAESPNFRAAAKVLGITQPALSVRMKRLQEAAKFPILLTQGRRKVLHPRFQAFVRTLSESRKELMATWNTVTEAEVPASDLRVVLSGRRELWDGRLPTMTFPGTIVLDPGDSARVVQDVLAGNVDIAVSHIRPDSSEVTARAVFDMEWELVYPKKWGACNAAALQTKPSAFYKPGGGFTPEVRSWMRREGLPSPFEKYVIEDWRLIGELLEAGLAWTIAPSSLTWDESKIRRLKISGQTPLRFFAFIRKDRLKRGEIRALWEQVLR